MSTRSRRLWGSGVMSLALAATQLSVIAPSAGAATSTSPTPTWVGEQGTGLGSTIGSAASSGTCDVNGDKHADVVAGGWFWDKAPYKGTGAAYVILGSDRPQGGGLDNPPANSAVRINGPSKANAGAGFSVACLGDTNKDGYDDIAVTDFSDQRVYVVYGTGRFESLNLDYLGSRGYVIQAPADAGNFGYQVAGLGDVNGDGQGDIGITAVVAGPNGRKNSGRAYIVAGGPGSATVDVTTSSRVLGTVDGARAGDRLSAISRAGDVNGDGVPDIALGAYVATPDDKSTANGAAYVVYGRKDGRFGSVDTANLGDKGFTIAGPARQRDRLGMSVAPAGDINKDGLADLIIGADGVSNATTGDRNGGAVILYGSKSGKNVRVDPTARDKTVVDDDGARGWWIQGADKGDDAGYSVAGLGDVNGDGTPDVAIGAFGADGVDSSGNAIPTSGAAYVVYGRTDAASVNLKNLDAAHGTTMYGTAKGQRLGRAVAGVGDVDKNGTPDLAAGGDGAGSGNNRGGVVTMKLSGSLKTWGTVTGRAPAPATAAMTTPTIPAGTPDSMAFSERNWKPTATDTCSAELHAKYSVIGNDGKRYPGWHPASVVDPTTKKLCTFGHEHGDDPRTSKIYTWVSTFLSKDGTDAKGIPFGMTSEASMEYDAGHDMRHEDNVGHKIFVANDVPLLKVSDHTPITSGGKAVSCDYLLKMHQGSHSSDATKNNAHELMYAVSCTDGTKAIISTLSRLGNANEYNRGCDPTTVVKTTGSTLPAGSGGRRLIPDTTCIDTYELVPSGQRSDIWGLYEVWETANQITKADGTVLASYSPWMAVRNPSRVADVAHPGNALSTLSFRSATDSADGGTAQGWPWNLIPAGTQDQSWIDSPFNGAQRDLYLSGTSITNPGATTIWYTDPYGRNASTTPFKGSVKQYLSAGTDDDGQARAARVNLGLDTDFGAKGSGVHAPN